VQVTSSPIFRTPSDAGVDSRWAANACDRARMGGRSGRSVFPVELIASVEQNSPFPSLSLSEEFRVKEQRPVYRDLNWAPLIWWTKIREDSMRLAQLSLGPTFWFRLPSGDVYFF